MWSTLLFQECPVGEKDWIVRIREQLKKLFPQKEFHMVSLLIDCDWSFICPAH